MILSGSTTGTGLTSSLHNGQWFNWFVRWFRCRIYRFFTRNKIL
jgi:hypothetical protein